MSQNVLVKDADTDSGKTASDRVSGSPWTVEKRPKHPIFPVLQLSK
jgi:hypothetical protein